MSPVENAISRLAAAWRNRRQRARQEGGRLFYWVFAYLGGMLGCVTVANFLHKQLQVTMPMHFFWAAIVALLWVRSSWYRLSPIKMFGVTLVLVFLMQLEI